MIKYIKIAVATVALFLGLHFGIWTNSVNAISNSMTVSPPHQRVILEPGESYTGYLQVSNANDSVRGLKYSVGIGSFSEHGENGAKDNYGVVDHINKSSYNQIMDWIVLNKTSGIVAPNETDTVSYTINVPKDAPAGGQYATILIMDETDSDDLGGGNVKIQSKFQFASIIYAEVAGETREEGQITNNSVPSFLLNGPLEAISMVRNNGNVHTDAEYTLQVWPLFSDEEICTNEEKPDTSLILPETERYHAQTCDLPAVGIFRAKQTVKIFGETSIVEKTVIICPIWLLFIIIFVIIAIIIWIVMRIRARNKSDNAKRKAEMEK